MTPPVTNKDTNPSENSIGLVKRIRAPQSVASQLKVLMAEGTPTAIVVIENAMLV